MDQSFSQGAPSRLSWKIFCCSQGDTHATLGTYSHVLPTMQVEAAGKFDHLLQTKSAG